MYCYLWYHCNKYAMNTELVLSKIAMHLLYSEFSIGMCTPHFSILFWSVHAEAIAMTVSLFTRDRATCAQLPHHVLR